MSGMGSPAGLLVDDSFEDILLVILYIYIYIIYFLMVLNSDRMGLRD